MALTFLFTGCAALQPRAKADFIEPTTGMEFVYVKGGTYMMGDLSGLGHRRETPVHQVAIRDLTVGMHEVTFDQYDKFCEATGREKPNDNEWGRGKRPVINVSWHDAMAFADWLGEQTGYKFALPSEAQWEYFARAKMTSHYWAGDKIPEKSANCAVCGNKSDNVQTVPVGTFPPNQWNIYDTLGNVKEWCLDDYNSNYDGAPINEKPWLNEGRKAMFRGGSWRSPKTILRSSSRDYASKGYTRNDLGFRLVMNNPPLIQ